MPLPNITDDKENAIKALVSSAQVLETILIIISNKHPEVFKEIFLEDESIWPHMQLSVDIIKEWADYLEMR